MRKLARIHPNGSATLIRQSSAAAAFLAAVPLTTIGALAWVYAPTSPWGRPVVALGLLGVLTVLTALARPRKATVSFPPNAVLRWEEPLERDDPYRVVLAERMTSLVLLEHDDPAVVLADARRVAEATGVRFQAPDWAGPAAHPEELTARVISGSLWPAQKRAARAAQGGAIFILVVFLWSIRAESEVSLLSALLPLASVALALVVGAVLLSLRVRVDVGPHGLRMAKVLFGRSRVVLDIPAAKLLALHTVTHPRFAPRHLLVETSDGPVALGVAVDWNESGQGPRTRGLDPLKPQQNLQ